MPYGGGKSEDLKFSSTISDHYSTLWKNLEGIPFEKGSNDEGTAEESCSGWRTEELEP